MLLGFVAVLVVVAIIDALTGLGGDGDPSGGGRQGMGTTATLELTGAA